MSQIEDHDKFLLPRGKKPRGAKRIILHLNPHGFFFFSSGSPIREEGGGKRGISESLCRTSVAAAVINTDEQVFRGAEFL